MLVTVVKFSCKLDSFYYRNCFIVKNRSLSLCFVFLPIFNHSTFFLYLIFVIFLSNNSNVSKCSIVLTQVYNV